MFNITINCMYSCTSFTSIFPVGFNIVSELYEYVHLILELLLINFLLDKYESNGILCNLIILNGHGRYNHDHSIILQ